MKTKPLLAGLAIVLLGGAAWLLTTYLAGDGPSAARGVGIEPTQPSAAEVEIDLAAAPVAPTPVDEDRTSAVAQESSDPLLLPAGELGGLIGRVVEEDGTPVADISVALAQVDASLLLAADWSKLGEEPPELMIDETRTNEEGRFRLDGGYDSSFQGLAIDLRGPRSTLRVVDMQMHHGEVSDIGDVVLAKGCTVFGRVVDAAGAPVSGARVRVMPAPKEELDNLLAVGPQDFRADCAVGISSFILNGSGSPVIDLPPLIRKHIDDVPIPTTTTNEAGEYRIEGVPIGQLVQGVDKRGLLGVGRVVTTTAGEVELDDAVMTPGRTIEGTVVNQDGDPQADVEVLVGSELSFGEVAILHPAGRTGADGRFSLSGCPETGGIMACGRRNPEEPWVGALDAAGEELEIELANSYSLTVRVIDTSGEPVTGAEIELTPAFNQESPMRFIAPFMALGAAPREARIREKTPGLYVCDQLAAGEYEVLARPKALAVARQSVDLSEDDAELTLTCEGGQSLELTVVEGGTRKGVSGARVSIVAPRPPEFLAALAVGRTGADGKVVLGPYTMKEGEERGFGWMRGTHVLVQHPRYADASVKLEEGTAIKEVVLLRGGEISGRIQWGTEPPQDVYMLMLENREGVDGLMEAFLPPRFGRSGLTGEFRFTNLPPGEYRISVFDQFFDQSPFELLLQQKEPTMLHRERDVMVETAGRTEVLIDLSPGGRGQTARLAGTVTVDDQPVEGATVQVWASGSSASATTDAFGYYETGDFLAQDDANVRVNGPLVTASGETEDTEFFSGQVTAQPQSVHRLDLDLHSTSLQVKVVMSGTGTPVVGAQVRARPSGSWSGSNSDKTNDEGEVELAILSSGNYTVSVSATGYADVSREVDTSASDFDGSVTIELATSVPCAGIADLSVFDASGNTGAWMRIAGENGESGWQRLDKEDLDDDGRASFSFNGLRPGSYDAHVWFNGQQSDSIAFDLPEGGDENLLFVFARSEGDD